MGIFSLPFCEWCLLRVPVTGIFSPPFSIGARYGYNAEHRHGDATRFARLMRRAQPTDTATRLVPPTRWRRSPAPSAATSPSRLAGTTTEAPAPPAFPRCTFGHLFNHNTHLQMRVVVEGGAPTTRTLFASARATRIRARGHASGNVVHGSDSVENGEREIEGDRSVPAPNLSSDEPHPSCRAHCGIASVHESVDNTYRERSKGNRTDSDLRSITTTRALLRLTTS
eukprot:1194560-Prorocentrum_minimum.AAC.6